MSSSSCWSGTAECFCILLVQVSQAWDIHLGDSIQKLFDESRFCRNFWSLTHYWHVIPFLGDSNFFFNSHQTEVYCHLLYGRSYAQYQDRFMQYFNSFCKTCISNVWWFWKCFYRAVNRINGSISLIRLTSGLIWYKLKILNITAKHEELKVI